MLLSFMAVPSVIASSPLIGQWDLIMCSISSLLCHQPCIMYHFSSCRWAHSYVTTSISSMDVHTGIFAAVLMAFTFMIMPVTSRSFSTVWLAQGSQSAKYRSGPGFYIMHTMYWCKCNIMYCSHWDNVAISLLSIATNGLWSVMMYTSLAKQ